MKVRILGCGTSTGVPRIGNDWGQCDPREPRNRRSRASILVEDEGVRILVDTSPDMREQLLAAGVDRIDAVLWTHDHADHVNGIDDLRQLFHNEGTPVRCFARAEAGETIARRFGYVFKGSGFYPPVASLEQLPDQLTLGSIGITVVDQPHGRTTATGLVFTSGQGAFVYATDFNRMTEDMRAAYQGAKLWIVDALRREPHPSHASLPEALAWTDELAISRAVLVHMDKSMDYRELCATLPAHVVPAHDGMEIVLE